MKGFLLIDPKKNSVVITDNEVISQLVKGFKLEEVKQHKTQSELFSDIKKYLKEGE